MRRLRWRHATLPVLGLIALALGPLVWAPLDPVAYAIKPCAPPTKRGSFPTATVERVSDGDTVILRFPDGRRERTRLIGIDTPETHAGAKLERDAASRWARPASSRAVQRTAGPTARSNAHTLREAIARTRSALACCPCGGGRAHGGTP